MFHLALEQKLFNTFISRCRFWTGNIYVWHLRGRHKPVRNSMMARAVGVPVGQRLGGRLVMTLVAIINDIIFTFSFFSSSSTFLIEGVLGSKNLFSKSWRERQKTDELLEYKISRVLDDMATIKTIQTQTNYVPWLSEDAKRIQKELI